jgi:alpha/beta superfamily hydrolase
MTARAFRIRSAHIAGAAGALEALVDAPRAAPRAVAVVCHPHPLHGGTMHNKVVHTLAKSFVGLGAATVRFNFRGVGGSAGSYADGAGELDDALAVAAWGTREWPGVPLYLAGFSFGAAVALRAAVLHSPRGLVTVALPVARVPADLATPACPWLVVHGGVDEIVALDAVRTRLASFAPPPKLVVVEGATHFFHGKLTVLGKEVTDFLASDFDSASDERSAAGADLERFDAQRSR